MTKPNENQNDNSLSAWATGKLASIAIGLAVGTFIYKSGVISKVIGKFFPLGENKSAFNFSNQSKDNRNE